MSMKDLSYSAVMGRKNEIIKDAMGVDYRRYEREGIIFDYEAMMADCGYSLEDHIRIQRSVNVGNTPVFELHNLTALARKLAGPGKGGNKELDKTERLYEMYKNVFVHLYIYICFI